MKQLIKDSLDVLAARLGPHRHSNSAPRLWVLMYHRILPRSDDRFAREEPGMIVTPDSFRQQLRALKQLFEVMRLEDWLDRRQRGLTLPQRACAITFDDGWLDNFEYALPILEQEQVPATLFAVADMIGTKSQFWPNRLTRLLHAMAEQPTAGRHWLNRIPDYRPGQTLDRENLAGIIRACKQLSDMELLSLLSEGETDLGLKVPDAPALVDWEQLRVMQRSGFVDVGSHTCHHYRLIDSLPTAILEQEIVDSRQRLERELDQPVPLFCYPNGDANHAAKSLVRKHYAGAVTTQRGINRSDCDPHGLLRVGIHEDISATPNRFEARLAGWR